MPEFHCPICHRERDKCCYRCSPTSTPQMQHAIARILAKDPSAIIVKVA